MNALAILTTGHTGRRPTSRSASSVGSFNGSDIVTDLGHRVATDGIDVLKPSTLRRLEREARRLGLHPELVDELVNAEAPAVVRERIVGLILRSLGTGTGRESSALAA